MHVAGADGSALNSIAERITYTYSCGVGIMFCLYWIAVGNGFISCMPVKSVRSC